MVIFQILLYLIVLSSSGHLFTSAKSHNNIISSDPGNYVNDLAKIVDGYNVTDIQEYPYQAYLIIGKKGNYYGCGGSIISRRYILTAAHCLIGAKNVSARIGSIHRTWGGSQYSARSCKTHPMYNSTTQNYDVGLIRTRTSMNIDGINTRIISLAPSWTTVPAGTILTVSGWGKTAENGTVSSSLMAVRVPAVSSEDCGKSYNNIHMEITINMFCAGFLEGGKDSCQGDSGSAAVSDGIQRGIVSFGKGCARPDYPSVYTKVSRVRNWIKRTTGV